MVKIVASNVIARKPPERRATATPKFVPKLVARKNRKQFGLESSLKVVSTINKIQAHRDRHALRIIVHILFLNIELKLCPSRPPEALIVLSQHSSFLSQTQLFLIPSTALCYPGHSSFLSCATLSYLTHSSCTQVHKICRSCTSDNKELCKIRKSCVRDNKELCMG